MALPNNHRLSVQYHNQLAGVRHDHIKALIALAMVSGWTRTGTGRGVHLVAPDGHPINIPDDEGLNNDTFKQYVRTVLNHRDPGNHAPTAVLVEQVLCEFKLSAAHDWLFRQAGELPRPKRKKGKATEAEVRGEVEITTPDIDGQDKSEQTLSKAAREHMGDPEPVQAPRKVRPLTAVTVGPAASAPGQRVLVSEAPWVDKRDMESPRVMEQHWSDGSTDYRCRWPGCTRTEEIPQKIAFHYGAGHTKAEKRGAPPASSVAVLEEWTPEQMRDTLERIVALLAPSMQAQIDDLTHRQAALEQQVADATEAARQATERADSMESELEAFSALASEMAKRVKNGRKP